MPETQQKEVKEQLGFAPLLQGATKKEKQSVPKESEVNREQLAPMLRQYLDTKDDYPDHLLFFQVGDFYEVFFDDAEVVANALQIRLTSRDKNKTNPIPMCGVPQHAIDNYIPRLLEKGFSCVLVSQLEDAKHAKGMVKRGVTRIVTPGVRFDGDGLDEKKFNYLASIVSASGAGSAVAYVDISTGRMRVQDVETAEEAYEVLRRIHPSEVVLPLSLNGAPLERSAGWLRLANQTAKEIGAKIVHRPFEFRNTSEVVEKVNDWLVDFESGADPKDLLEQVSPVGVSALAASLAYVEEVSYGCKPVLAHFGVDQSSRTVFIDSATRRNLELTETRIDGERKNSLIQHLDYAKTAMGSRLLRDWILCPSTDKPQIEVRYDAIDELMSQAETMSRLRTIFVSVRDIDRLSARISGLRATPRDLRVLLDSISSFPELQNLTSTFTSSLLKTLSKEFDSLDDVRTKLEKALVDEPPVKVSDGGIVRTGYHEEIDRLRHIRSEGKSWLAELEAKEKQATGISGLKIKYNNVFGYFIEVSKAHSAKVPANYERKQTLVNAERYVTTELKEREREILSAKVRQFEIEREVFVELRTWLSGIISRLQRSSRVISTLDVLCSLAHLARQNNYTRPILTEESGIHIVAGRHPVIERIIGPHNFVPNDTNLDAADSRMAILTGPNMGGKSTYLRQVGLIQLLAQAGSFVPADKAELGMVDRIFTRIGAADDLSRGDSTFMVEMREASTIIRKASASSLVLIDEIGRGTATHDGLALALSIAEWLHDTTKCRTIFATHFHELTRLVGQREGAFCLAVGIIEKPDEIVFTHRIENRVAEKSFGLEVAQLAGLPDALVNRARVLLEGLQENAIVPSKPRVEQVVEQKSSVSDTVIERLRELTPNAMTPFDALGELVKLKRIVEGETN